MLLLWRLQYLVRQEGAKWSELSLEETLTQKNWPRFSVGEYLDRSGQKTTTNLEWSELGAENLN